MTNKKKINPNHSNINTDELFFNDSDLTSGSIDKIVSDSLHKADDGELFLEFCESESFVYDDQKLKSASFDVSKGFGLRAISGEATGYAHSSDIDLASLKKASDTVNFITKITMEVLILVLHEPIRNFILIQILLIQKHSKIK